MLVYGLVVMDSSALRRTSPCPLLKEGVEKREKGDPRAAPPLERRGDSGGAEGWSVVFEEGGDFG